MLSNSSFWRLSLLTAKLGQSDKSALDVKKYKKSFLHFYWRVNLWFSMKLLNCLLRNMLSEKILQLNVTVGACVYLCLFSATKKINLSEISGDMFCRYDWCSPKRVFIKTLELFNCAFKLVVLKTKSFGSKAGSIREVSNWYKKFKKFFYSFFWSVNFFNEIAKLFCAQNLFLEN